MTYHAPLSPSSPGTGAQIAQLHQILTLVEEMGEADLRRGDPVLDMARVANAYQASSPIVRRQFDALAEETERWAAAAVEALIGSQPGQLRRPSRPAARRVANELAKALDRLEALLD